MGHNKKHLSQLISKTVDLKYLVYIPKSYDMRKEWPLIIFLHGAGEGGSDLERVKLQGLPKRLESEEDFPFVVVSPQCPDDATWDMKHDDLYALHKTVKEDYHIDEKKIYLTGLSMGGFGTWSLAVKYPKAFAAIAPICGGLLHQASVINLKDMPVWAFHGQQDNRVPIQMTENLVELLMPYGHIIFTSYPDKRHDSWTVTYDNDDLYDWFLKYQLK